jgi:hypothetical protein
VDVIRPRSIPAVEAGRAGIGGWIAPGGQFYPAPQYRHIRVGHELKQTGEGPTEPWDMRDGWVMVRADGEALALPDRVTQPQLDMLADVLLAAPVGSYRSALLVSLRRLLEFDVCSSRPVRGAVNRWALSGQGLPPRSGGSW